MRGQRARLLTILESALPKEHMRRTIDSLIICNDASSLQADTSVLTARICIDSLLCREIYGHSAQPEDCSVPVGRLS